MFHPLVLSLFLYFPEDKSEYIPASISFVIFLIGAFITMRIILKHSKKEAEKAKKLEEQILNNKASDKNS
ncbi:hypothetical protein [Neobacillus kokaensis]|uniref:Uncharacterized protein n=1 Tax=Neobacillus kokaensis TaxID=2759023 RepID=A0ABQ3MZ08_9BACI|nr:hypothetical protein [Neobacillus kokaensis]GHH97667.1 hypothetical protein AM1BK_12100 [Neobacillus kokaensis]